MDVKIDTGLVASSATVKSPHDQVTVSFLGKLKAYCLWAASPETNL
jgi:hypothetical protein